MVTSERWKSVLGLADEDKSRVSERFIPGLAFPEALSSLTSPPEFPRLTALLLQRLVAFPSVSSVGISP